MQNKVITELSLKTIPRTDQTRPISSVVSRIRYGLPVLIAGILLLLSSCAPQSETFRFVFLTDIHIQPELRAREGTVAAFEKINELQPDFVITGGDLIMDALAVSYGRADSLYTLYNSVLQDFTIPVYNSIGNHEIFGLNPNSGISESHPEYGKNMYKDRLGAGNTYTSFDHKGWHFITLDGIGFTEDRQYYGHIDSLQIVWLKNDLSAVDFKTPIVVSTHIPFVSVYTQMTQGSTTGLSNSSVITNGKDVLELFEGHNLKLVLQGHLHEVEEIIYKGTHYITAGAVSGAWWRGPREGFPEGFAVVDVVGDEFTWQYESYGWQAQTE